MSESSSVMSTSVAPGTHLSKGRAKRHREHLRHIHRMTHEQQIALIEEARAARSQEQHQNQ